MVGGGRVACWNLSLSLALSSRLYSHSSGIDILAFKEDSVLLYADISVCTFLI